MTIVRNKVKHILDKKGISQKEFAEMTGLREATISDICRNAKASTNLEHLAIIMNALKVRDFNEIYEFIQE